MDLKKEVQFIKGVGPSRVKLLNKLGIATLEDLITYYPRNYEDRSQPKNIAELVNGEEALISAYPVRTYERSENSWQFNALQINGKRRNRHGANYLVQSAILKKYVQTKSAL